MFRDARARDERGGAGGDVGGTGGIGTGEGDPDSTRARVNMLTPKMRSMAMPSVVVFIVNLEFEFAGAPSRPACLACLAFSNRSSQRGPFGRPMPALMTVISSSL